MTTGDFPWPSFASDGTLAEYRNTLANQTEQAAAEIPTGRDAVLYAVLMRLADVELQRQDLENRLAPLLTQLVSDSKANAEQLATIKQELLTAQQERTTTSTALDRWASEAAVMLDEAKLMSIQARSSAYRTASKADQAILDVHCVERSLEATVEITYEIVTQISDEVGGVTGRLDATALEVAESQRAVAHLSASLGKAEERVRLAEERALVMDQLASKVDELVGEVQASAKVARGARADAEKAKSYAQHSTKAADELRAEFGASISEVAESQRSVANLTSSLDKANERARLAEERALIMDQLASKVDQLVGEVQASAEVARVAQADAEKAKSYAQHSTKAADELRAELDSKISQISMQGPLHDEAYRNRLATALHKIELEAEREKSDSVNVPEGAGPKRDPAYADKYRDRWLQHVKIQAAQRQQRTDEQR